MRPHVPAPVRRTKIVATLGPTSSSLETIDGLIAAGMDAARINFSHGSYESRLIIINTLKQAREELNAPIPLILDTKGPEIRIKNFDEDRVYLEQGNPFRLTTRDVPGSAEIVSVTYSDLPRDVRIGSRILIDDGLIELSVVSAAGTEIDCVVVNSGFLSSRKGVNVPDVYVNLPSITEKDVEDIKFGIEAGFDYIAASFVRSAKDVLKIREVLEANGGSKLKIIAKIESRDGVNNIDSILEVADGIMVARGDLGVEIPPEEVPLVQKRLIRRANQMGKPVITATQMLESMVSNPRPTRAEANDVANAIFDGSDAIMLSGETANGKYPIESVKMMGRIAVETEKSINYGSKIYSHHEGGASGITNAISYATCLTANDLGSPCIVTVTSSGFTARMVSKFQPPCPVIAVTPNESVWRQLNLLWGCVPIFSELGPGGDIFLVAVDKAEETGLAATGDAIVIVAGVPVGVAGTTNIMKVQIVGDVLVKGRGLGERAVSGRSCVVRVYEEFSRSFQPGDIIVISQTDDRMMPYIKKASALVVGSDKNADTSHAETVARALDLPIIFCGDSIVDVIPNGSAITVDSEKGFVYNGVRK